MIPPRRAAVRTGCLAALALALTAAAVPERALAAPCSPLESQVAGAASGTVIHITSVQVGCHLAYANKDLTFKGETSTAAFDGGDGSDPIIDASGTGTMVVQDLTFRNGSTTSAGGAVRTQNSVVPQIINSRFFANHAVSSGGAVAIATNAATPIVIRDSVFGATAAGQGNSTNGNGGALSVSFDSTGALELGRTLFAGNSAVRTGGGAQIQAAGRIAIGHSRFIGNKVVDPTPGSNFHSGGGATVFSFGSQSVTQVDNLFQDNSVSYSQSSAPGFGEPGGGGEWTNALTSSTSDRFVKNIATNADAAGPHPSGGGLQVLGCLTGLPGAFTDSQARNLVAAGNRVAPGGEGAGVYVGCSSQPVHMQLLNSTIAGNAGGAALDGGAQDQLMLRNSIVSSGGTTSALSGFAIRTISSSEVCTAPHTRAPGPANICADPRLKQATAGDIHETYRSPTQDKGNNGLVPPGLTRDFEGGARITDFEPDGVATVDMGADESRIGPLRMTLLRAGPRTVTFSGRRGRLITFTFRITGPARATFRFVRLLSHHRTRRAGAFARNLHHAGRQRIGFRGRIGHRRLAAGLYRLTVSAKNRLGNRSNKVTVRFRVRAP